MTPREEFELLTKHIETIRQTRQDLEDEMREIERKLEAKRKWMAKHELSPEGIIKNGGFYEIA